MKYIYTYLCMLLLVLLACSNDSSNNKQGTDEPEEVPLPPITGAPLLWGFDNAGSELDNTITGELIDYFGFDLAIYHFHPQKSGNSAAIQNLGTFYSNKNVRLLLNLESANNDGSSFIDDNGFDWFNRPDGRHYFMFPEEVMNTLSNLPSGTGVMYDEAEHMQNRFRMEPSYFMKQDDAASLEVASETFTNRVREIADYYKRYGIDTYTEHVFPIQFHTFADGGLIPVSKILKESCIPAYIACSLGAAIQYGKPFWLSPDLWYYNEYPGHDADQYQSALLMAYHMGAEAIYTENIAYPGDNGLGGLVKMNGNMTTYTVTELGKVAKWFRWEYAPENPRSYRFTDLVPKVAIIRQEDACWGQSASWLEDQLFGVEGWKSNETTEAWLELWHLLSNGEISPHSICWHNDNVVTTPYTVFAPLDGVVVFDQKVEAKFLNGVELIFLTGIGVSEPTLNAVKDRVEQGAVCVALPHLVPDDVRHLTGDNGMLDSGLGKWVVTTSFLTNEVKNHVQAFLPQENYMRYRFGNTEVQFRPLNNNKDKITVSVQPINH